jgi:NTE family protein
VATDLETGREIWLREGSLLSAVRASMGLPGLVTPERVGGRWLVDGGLVNAVPVSLCRALGADTVIAVDLATTLLRRRFGSETPIAPDPRPAAQPLPPDVPAEPGGLRAAIDDFVADLRRRLNATERSEPDAAPSIFEVVANSINIMQVRITSSRMAGDPPELLIRPQLVNFALLDFDRAAEAIAEGYRATRHALALARDPESREPVSEVRGT